MLYSSNEIESSSNVIRLLLGTLPGTDTGQIQRLTGTEHNYTKNYKTETTEQNERALVQKIRSK